MTVDALVIAGHALGDLVMQIPLLRQLAVHGGVDLVVAPQLAWLAQHVSGIGKVLPWSLRDAHSAAAVRVSLQALRRTLAAGDYLAAYGLASTHAGYAATLKRVCFPVDYRGLDYRQHAYVHFTDAVLQELGRWQTVTDDGIPRLERLTDRDARVQWGRYAVVQPGSSHSGYHGAQGLHHKALPTATWSACLQQLLADDMVDHVLITGSPRERFLADAITATLAPSLQARVLAIHDTVPLCDHPALLRDAVVTLSVDTGMAHLAAAAGGRVVVAFGPSSEHRFAPRGPGSVALVCGSAACRPCYQTPAMATCAHNICMDSIRAADLISAATTLMSPSAPHAAAG